MHLFLKIRVIVLINLVTVLRLFYSLSRMRATRREKKELCGIVGSGKYVGLRIGNGADTSSHRVAEMLIGPVV